MKSGILYQGPSLIDGAPIVAVITSGSRNTKTGDMLQSWVLRADVAPHVAIHTGEDRSICGDCPKRGSIVNGKNADRECYVTVFQAPLSVYKKFRRGGYDWIDPVTMGSGRMVRIGSYGDPMAVPAALWSSLVHEASGWTGYTHQWRARGRMDVAAYQPLVMASADTMQDKIDANAEGWRTFRVREPGAPKMAGEIVCPASSEAGHRTTCATCRMCQGTSTKSRREPVIEVHGIARNRYLRKAA